MFMLKVVGNPMMIPAHMSAFGFEVSFPSIPCKKCTHLVQRKRGLGKNSRAILELGIVQIAGWKTGLGESMPRADR